MRNLTFILVLAVVCACSNRLRSKQEGAPTPGDVLAACTRGLVDANRFSLELARDEPGIVDWNLFFDDIPILGMVGWSRSADRWKIECYPSRRGPETVRRTDLISEERAASQARSANPLAKGPMHRRLVYYAMQKPIPRFPGATNAMDYDMVIDQYELMFEVKDERGEGALVDAYTGAVFMPLTNVRT